jgi:hypothetical protein
LHTVISPIIHVDSILDSQHVRPFPQTSHPTSLGVPHCRSERLTIG